MRSTYKGNPKTHTKVKILRSRYKGNHTKVIIQRCSYKGNQKTLPSPFLLSITPFLFSITPYILPITPYILPIKPYILSITPYIYMPYTYFITVNIRPYIFCYYLRSIYILLLHIYALCVETNIVTTYIRVMCRKTLGRVGRARQKGERHKF